MKLGRPISAASASLRYPNILQLLFPPTKPAIPSDTRKYLSPKVFATSFLLKVFNCHGRISKKRIWRFHTSIALRSPQFSPLCFRGMIGSGIENWNRVLFWYRDAPSCVSAIALQWRSMPLVEKLLTWNRSRYVGFRVHTQQTFHIPSDRRIISNRCCDLFCGIHLRTLNRSCK